MIIDILIIILLISAIARGHDIGLVRQLLSAGGFIGGLFLGAALQPLFVDPTADATSQALIALSLTVGCALACLVVGEFIGVKFKRKLMQVMHLNKADAIIGSFAGGASLLVAVWLLAPMAPHLPSEALRQTVGNSRLVSLVGESLPSAPKFIASLDRIINPNGFPDVFADLDRKPLDDGAPLPELGDLRPAVERARASVVKLEGKGCGGIVEGSGYVARNGIVVTNAHVVAGVDEPVVLDAKGSHDATVIWFDPDMDMAVLRVSGLAGAPLPGGPSKVPKGTAGAVLGYPGGGSFRAGAANVLDHFSATGRDIYESRRTSRDIYELKADIIPGNSGGPLINAQGAVIGLVFAESTSYETIGYALTMGPVTDSLERAIRRDAPVGTGACAR